MYQIALCDDMASELMQAEELLDAYGKKHPELKYQTEKFENAQKMLVSIKEKGKPDLLLIDVFMPGETGIEAVRKLRGEGVDTPVIFLTTSREYALEAYQVDALQYLVKPLEKEKFFHAMDLAFETLRKEGREPLVFKTSGGLKQITPDQIIYCEAQRNYQILFLKEETVKIRITGGELYRILQGFSEFLRCGSSYIINLNHITAVDREEICMDNGSRIYVPRNKATEFRKMYFSFYFGRE